MDLLPEECICRVLARTSPRDACKLAAVSPIFRSAAASDDLWEHFLPSDYVGILARAIHLIRWESKRDLYFHLCDQPLIVDGGRMSFSLDRSTGAKCYMLSARELDITWSAHPNYWRWTRLPDSRFSEVAELLDVCWLHIHGNIESELLSRKTTYAAFLIYKLSKSPHGLDETLQEASVIVGAQRSECKVQLLDVGASSNTHRSPRPWKDEWMEMELGEFDSNEGEDGTVEILLKEHGGHWKNGLIIQGIEIKAKRQD